MVGPSLGVQPKGVRQTNTLSKADAIAIGVWVAGTVAASVLWYQWALAHRDLPIEMAWASIIAFFVSVPLVSGLLSGLLIRRDGRWLEILVFAALGAACVVSALYSQAVQDARECSPDPGIDCDTGYALGAMLIFAICYVPFLAGAGVGKAVALRGTPRSAMRASVPAVIAEARWAPIGTQAWRYFVREFRPAPTVSKLVMLAVFAWSACFYAFVGPLVFDVAYYLLGLGAGVRARRRLRVGVSLVLAVAYVIGLLVWGMTTPS